MSSSIKPFATAVKGVSKYQRLQIAVEANRDERTVSKWLQHRPINDRAARDIEAACTTLGIARPAAPEAPATEPTEGGEA